MPIGIEFLPTLANAELVPDAWFPCVLDGPAVGWPRVAVSSLS